ncbi:sulfite exporter TauE/SafE family protein [Rubinisphaera italica]|uniref:Probable membrane transporter protein n=1 Tax=Rubinisphaera italica TaxID=2527969 RepID=A0A5C5XF69_9PLAN|nr:sulfite exporter TauE/SafE family protein [Rubinisphaera italica]TWT61630.1 Sulfite exporter TauE/SafE [Rubinisphaera italica]
MELSVLEMTAIAVIILFSGVVQSAIGFGYALVAMALLPFFLGVKPANLIVSYSAFAPIALAAWAYRKEMVRESILLAVTSALLALPLGIAVLVYVDDDLLVRFTGLIILAMAIDGLVRKATVSTETTTSNLWTILAGAASGFLAGAVTIGGPPIAIYAARQPWSPRKTKAFLTTFLLVVTTIKLFGLMATDLVGREILFLSAFVIPFGFLGGQIGVRVGEKINPRLFRYLILSMLAVTSSLMIIRGAPDGEKSAPEKTTTTLQKTGIRGVA